MDLSDYGSEAIVSREQPQQLTTYHPKSKLFLFVEKAPGFLRIRQFDALKFQPSALRLSRGSIRFHLLIGDRSRGRENLFSPIGLCVIRVPGGFPEDEISSRQPRDKR